MDFLVENVSSLIAIITSICGTTTIGGIILGIISFVKASKTEKRIAESLEKTNQSVKITREGIVQAFKDAIVPKDIKVSLNEQVVDVLDKGLDKFMKIVSNGETERTRMMYWCLRIFSYTAAYNKLTAAEQEEIKELLANIAEEERIVDTGVL